MHAYRGIRPRFKVRGNNLVSVSGHEITWSNSIRYLGVFFQ